MINITSRTFKSHLSYNTYLPTFMANIGDYVTQKIEFNYENVNVNTDKNEIILAPISINTLDVANVIYTRNAIFMASLRVGDTLELYKVGYWAGADTVIHTVTEIIDSNNFRTNGNYPSNAIFTNGRITNITPITHLIFNYNLVENGSSFVGLTDGELQELRCTTLDATNTATAQNCFFQGAKTYQTGSATIIGKGVTLGKQKFELTHTFLVTPLYLAGQDPTTKPAYFEGGESLNLINRIQIGKNFSDNLNVILPALPKNIGWYNESFNGGSSKYYIQSLVYSNTINALDFNVSNTVTIVLKTTGTFSGTSTKTRLNFNYLPDNSSDYIGNNQLYIDNFQFDSVTATNDSIPVTGSNIIKSVTSVKNDSTTITITAVLELSAGNRAIIKGNKNYILSLSTEDWNAPSVFDRVNLLVDYKSFAVQLAETNIVNFDTVFIQHPYSTRSFGIMNNEFDVMPVDDVVCNTSFNINFTDLQNDGIKILNVKPQLKLKHATEADIILDSFNINTTNIDVVNYDYSTGGKLAIQNIAFSQGRPFKIPNEIRRNIVLTRDFDNDNEAVNSYAFALNFPFMMRWEYWRQLILSNINSDFFDTTKEFNGINNDWTRLASIAGWDFVYSVTVEIIRLGVTYSQTEDYILNSVGFLANSDYSNNTIKSYDITTNDPINSGATWYLKGFENTKIVGTFNKTGASINPCIVLWIETFESGGQSDIRRISSEHDNDSQSWFVDNKVVITNPSAGVYKGTCFIDSTKLPQNTKYTLYARIYDKNVTEDVFRITNDMIIRSTMFGEKRIIL
jgi:hypothetical protein